MGIPIRHGRSFEPADRDRDVEIVSARTAARVWPGENPIGKRARRGDDGHPVLMEVIGVAADTRTTMGADSPLMVYRTYWKTHNEGTTRNFSLVLRTGQTPTAAATAVRKAIWSIDSELPVPEMTTMRQVIDAAVAQRRFQTILLGGFALAALLLAMIGIYGVISYSMNRRRNEIGIRMALGAQARDVTSMVLRQGDASGHDRIADRLGRCFGVRTRVGSVAVGDSAGQCGGAGQSYSYSCHRRCPGLLGSRPPCRRCRPCDGTAL